MPGVLRSQSARQSPQTSSRTTRSRLSGSRAGPYVLSGQLVLALLVSLFSWPLGRCAPYFWMGAQTDWAVARVTFLPS